MPPLVSILMTAYNREKFIAEAIESVLRSTYTNFELIVVDDVSKDETVDIIRSYQAKDNRIRFYINEKNLGDYQNRNKAGGYATGNYIMYVDSDDTLKPDSVENAVRVMEDHPSAGYGLYTPLKISTPVVFNGKTALRKHFFEFPFLMYGPVASIIRTELFRKINGYPELYGPANDLYFHLKVASVADIVALPFELVNYRRHEGQEINNTYSYLYNNYKYLHDALKELDLPLNKFEKNWLLKKNKRRFTVNLVKYFFRTGNITSTRNAMKQAGFTIKDCIQGIVHYYPKSPVV